ncbi:MAG TPA: S8 family peptidase [Chloroflexota bacterium]|nr:S8 family peptidase [Chloroflexota bacterium]
MKFLRRSALLPLIMSLAVLLPGAGGISASASGGINLDPNVPVHPYLQYGAQADPASVVRVIVQKTSSSVQSSLIALAVQTNVVEEFPFINALTLEVPLGLVPILAKVPGVKYITVDGPVKGQSIDPTTLSTTYEAAIGLPEVWNGSAGTPALTGAGIGVAVLDTGVNASLPDFSSNTLVAVNVNPNASGPQDNYGHGTHVVGLINGRDPQGRYIGVAPDARVVSVKISDDAGYTTESDLIRGLQWVYANHGTYNLRAVNLSLSSAIPTSYLVSPVAAATERLWRSGVVVVAASGNQGSAHDATWAVPGADPYVLTVGALDHNQTAASGDDSLATFSSRGKTQDGVYKPDVVAPGRKIVAPLAGTGSTLGQSYPDRITDGRYIRLSGTSMAAPITAGTVALLLQAYPNLSPDQVKWLLTSTDRTYYGQSDSAGVIDPLAALKRAAAGRVGSANQGLTPNGSSLLAPVFGLVQGLLGAVVGLVTDLLYWDSGYWGNTYYTAGHWDTGHWDTGHWDSGHWDSGHWDGGHWD